MKQMHAKFASLDNDSQGFLDFIGSIETVY